MLITDLLRRAHEGDSEALSEVIPLVYDELKNLASSHILRESAATPIETTELVHEAFIRIAGSRFPECENRSHFFGIAARVMRQVLVDMARTRLAAKRGPGLECALVELPDLGTARDDDFLALNDALNQLADESPIKSQIVEMRFFVGLTAEECAQMLSLPVGTVRRELRLAKAWLQNELSPDSRRGDRANEAKS